VISEALKRRRAGNVRLALAAALLASLGSLRGARACADDPLVREFLASGDDFRAVTVLRQRELERRGTPAGFECARLILGAYLRHGEFDLVDDWVARMGQLYGPPLLAQGMVPRLRVEVAYLFGNSAEVQRRAAEGGVAGLERLTTLSRAADRPLSFDPRDVTCDSPACAQLRRILDERSSLPHKSPGLALALGVIPGLGQVYAGRPLAGLGSFLLNGFLIGTTAFAIHRHEYALMVLSGGVGLAFYTGSIYAGFEAAMRVNEHSADELRARIHAVPADLAISALAQ
jgi:TM2 domain-containing membrane protein YozV